MHCLECNDISDTIFCKNCTTCVSIAGLVRQRHTPDKDGNCVFCTPLRKGVNVYNGKGHSTGHRTKDHR